MAVIYRATNNITGKIYIGYDPNWPKRQIAHKTKAKNGSKLYFHNAIRKYGWDNFAWDILMENGTLQDEMKLIEQYDSFNNGYNLTIGGEGASGYRHSEETKKIIGAHSKGNKNTVGKTWKKTKRQVENSRLAHSRKWEITDPNGNSFCIVGLLNFCRERNIPAQNMGKVAAGLRNKCHGYTCRSIP